MTRRGHRLRRAKGFSIWRAELCVEPRPVQRRDEVVDLIAQASFDRVKSVAEEIHRLGGLTMKTASGFVVVLGVVACPAHQRWTRSG